MTIFRGHTVVKCKLQDHVQIWMQKRFSNWYRFSYRTVYWLLMWGGICNYDCLFPSNSTIKIYNFQMHWPNDLIFQMYIIDATSNRLVTRPSRPTMRHWLPWFSLIYIIDIICLFIYLPIYLFTYLFIYLFIYLYIYLLIYLLTYLFIFIYLFLFIFLFVFIYLYLFI